MKKTLSEFSPDADKTSQWVNWKKSAQEQSKPKDKQSQQNRPMR